MLSYKDGLSSKYTLLLVEFNLVSNIVEVKSVFHLARRELANAIDKAAANLKTKLNIAAALYIALTPTTDNERY